MARILTFNLFRLRDVALHNYLDEDDNSVLWNLGSELGLSRIRPAL